MNQSELLILLLEHYPDWLTTGTPSGRPDGQLGARLLVHDPELDCEAFQELDQALTLMAKQGKQQAVRYLATSGANDGTEVSCSLATIRWHTIAWYMPSQYVQPRPYTRKRHGRNETIRPQTQPVRHPEAREDRARAGLTWLIAHYNWTKATPGINWLRKNDRIKGLTHVTGRAA